MKTNVLFFLTFIVSCLMVRSQSFAPAPGQVGSDAIHKDSIIFKAWGEQLTVERGWLDIAQKALGKVDNGQLAYALGKPEGDGGTCISLGDSGVATFSLSKAIFNGEGPDFAVFENGFADHYMELAFVEVSTDGVNYARFPATSETPLTPQLTNFAYGDCRYINNLAGKYRKGFGTPFDLEVLKFNAGIDVNQINYIRLIDVVGSVGLHASTDKNGNPINDPYPTPFASGGFDLDGIGFIHVLETNAIEEESATFSFYPNPFFDVIRFSEVQEEVILYGHNGVIIRSLNNVDELQDLFLLPKGCYTLFSRNNGGQHLIKVLKID